MVSTANGKAEEPAGTQEGVVFIYKVNLSFKVFAIFTEKMSTMWITKGGEGSEKRSSEWRVARCFVTIFRDAGYVRAPWSWCWHL